jgi:class 3 adenylate cyclase
MSGEDTRQQIKLPQVRARDFLRAYLGLGTGTSFKDESLERGFLEDYGKHSLEVLLAYFPWACYLGLVACVAMILLFPDRPEPKVLLVVLLSEMSVFYIYIIRGNAGFAALQWLWVASQTLMGWLLGLGLFTLGGTDLEKYVIILLAGHLVSSSLALSFLLSSAVVLHHLVVSGFALMALLGGVPGLADGIFQTVLLGSISTMCLFSVYQREVGSRVQFLQRRIIEQRETDLAAEKEKVDLLLLNILPRPIASRLKQDRQPISDSLPMVTVIFADLVGFTSMSSTRPPGELVQTLDELFSVFDELADRFGLEKIKTIGDAYMAAAGVPEPREDHAIAAAEMALAMLEALRQRQPSGGAALRLRVGMSSGPVIAGVIGRRKFSYDLWGDVVNVASRMESHGIPDQIQVTLATYELLKDRFAFTPRGSIEVKGKGAMSTYILTGAMSTA